MILRLKLHVQFSRDGMNKRVISLDFVSVNDLYLAYMPFIMHGGLFIPTKEQFELAEEVILDIRLVNEPDRHQIEGTVAWITPVGAQGGKPAGIGIQFAEGKSVALRNKIETHLAGLLQSPNSTNTM